MDWQHRGAAQAEQPEDCGRPKRSMVSAGGGSGSVGGFGIGFGGDLFGDGAGVFEDGDGEAVGLAGCVAGCMVAGLRLRSAAISAGGGFEVVVDGGVVGGGGSSLSSVVNSSSEKSSRQAALSTGWVRMASREYSMGTLGVDGDEFFGEEDVVAVVLERFAIGFALD